MDKVTNNLNYSKTMIYGQKKKINGIWLQKIYMMESTTKWKVKIDGVVYYDEHDTLNQAMEMAQVYFAQDRSRRKAEFLEYDVRPVGYVMYNKNYEEEAGV